MLAKTRLAVLLTVAACASASRGPTTVEEKRPRRAPTDSSAQLAEHLVEFSMSASQALNDRSTEPPASNSYSHQRLLGPRKRLGEPQVQLQPTEKHSSLSSTDCSGWLSFLINTVSPLHSAVLQSQRRREKHNRVYSETFALRESRRPWARAFVVTEFLRSEHAGTTGFEPIADFEQLRRGDIGAYAMGRYAKPSDDSRPTPPDTGHVFIVMGPPTVVDPETHGYRGRGTLHEDAAKVIAVPVIDSSSIIHFDPDSRKNEHGRYSLPKYRPHSRAKAGGVGSGTIWLALNDEGRVLQRRLGPHQKYRPVLARAGRLSGNIALDPNVLDSGDSLVVRVFDNTPAEFGGIPYGELPVNLTGEGGLRLASGRLVLKGENDFTGDVTVQAADLVVASPSGLGVGDVVVRGGTLTLREPAIADSATLSISEDVGNGAIHLDFKGSDLAKALQIRGVVHRCGTWGGRDSGAMFVDPVFSGRGVIELAGKCGTASTTARPSGRRR